jgi:hypothetical protein
MARTRSIVSPHVALLAACALALAACGARWHEYRSPEGNFVVSFPGADVVEREVNDLETVFRFATVAVDHTTAYGVSWYDIADPGKPVEEILREVQAKTLANLEAGLERASEIALGGSGGAPGRAFAARAASGVYVSVRIYAIGSKPMRIYQLTAAVPQPGPADADIERFFASFRLID